MQLTQEQDQIVASVAHMIGQFDGVKIVTIIAARDSAEQASELRRALSEIYGEDCYNPETHIVMERGVAARLQINDMIADDARITLHAAMDIVDQVRNAIGRANRGEFVDFNLLINQERFNVENYLRPIPRNADVGAGSCDSNDSAQVALRPMAAASGTAKFSGPVEAAPLAKFGLGAKVQITHGDGIRPMTCHVVAVTHYMRAEPMYKLEWVENGEAKSDWFVQSDLVHAPIIVEPDEADYRA